MRGRERFVMICFVAKKSHSKMCLLFIILLWVSLPLFRFHSFSKFCLGFRIREPFERCFHRCRGNKHCAFEETNRAAIHRTRNRTMVAKKKRIKTKFVPSTTPSEIDPEKCYSLGDYNKFIKQLEQMRILFYKISRKITFRTYFVSEVMIIWLRALTLVSAVQTWPWVKNWSDIQMPAFW